MRNLPFGKTHKVSSAIIGLGFAKLLPGTCKIYLTGQ